MISAGADVCAIDEQGRSVSDVAVHSGYQTVWTEALKYCGIDIRDVLVRPNTNPAHSTALSSQLREAPRCVTSKISLTEYLERRKAFGDAEDERLKARRVYIPEFSSSDDDESEDNDSEDYHSVNNESKDNESEDEDVGQNKEGHDDHEDSIVRGKAKLE